MEAVFKGSRPSSYWRQMHKPTTVLKHLLISLKIWENSFLHLQHGLSLQLLALICYLHGSLSTPENTAASNDQEQPENLCRCNCYSDGTARSSKAVLVSSAML